MVQPQDVFNYNVSPPNVLSIKSINIGRKLCRLGNFLGGSGWAGPIFNIMEFILLLSTLK